MIIVLRNGVTLMEKDTAELIVKVYAVLAWISAAIAVIAALGILLWGSVAGGMISLQGLPFAGMMAGLGIVFALLILCVGVFDVIVGFGLWKRKNWARIVTIIFSVISLFSFPLGTIIGGFGIWLFGFEPTVTGLFGAKPVANVQVSVKSTKGKAAKKKK